MSDIGPRKASAALRLLADDIDAGGEMPYALTYLNHDGKIASAYGTANQPFLLVGMLEDLKRGVMTQIQPAGE